MRKNIEISAELTFPTAYCLPKHQINKALPNRSAVATGQWEAGFTWSDSQAATCRQYFGLVG
jgi:hypothetical protein